MSITGDRRSRREFLSGMLAGAGFLALGQSGLAPARWALGTAAAAGPPPETTSLRLLQPGASLCTAPIYLAQEFLPGEGFREVQYVRVSEVREIIPALVLGKVDMAFHFAAPLAMGLDAGDPLVLLAGVHPGCFELFGTPRVRSIRDLKGATVGVPDLGGSPHSILSAMAAYVGIDPRKDITWSVQPRKHPQATKRALRAILTSALANRRGSRDSSSTKGIRSDTTTLWTC